MITIKTLSLDLPFLPRFTLLPSVPQWCRRIGDGQLRVRSWSVSTISSASFLSSLLPCSSMGSAPRDTGSHKLLQSGSSSCWGGPSKRDFSSMDHLQATVPALWAAAPFRTSPSTFLVWVLQGWHCGCCSGMLHSRLQLEPASPSSKRSQLLSSTTAVKC